MKKLLLICALIMGGTFITAPNLHAAESNYASKQLPEDARPITVYLVQQIVGSNAWSSSPKSAYYSASENRIYVNEGSRINQPYTIYENRAFGQEKDGRAEYRYTAGDYYFNL